MNVRIQQRLVGALVLLALIFLIAPVLLDGDGRIPEKITQIPPKPKRPDLSHIRVAEPAQDVLPTLPDSPAEADRAVSDTESDSEADKTGEPQTDQPDTVVLDNKAWSVQVASFQDGKKAARLREQLREQGYKTYVNEVILSDGTLFTQVLVGPDIKLERVRQRKEAIKEQTGLQGLVVRFEP